MDGEEVRSKRLSTFLDHDLGKQACIVLTRHRARIGRVAVVLAQEPYDDIKARLGK